MSETKTLTITLPDVLAEKVSAWVKSGRFGSESEVIAYGIDALETQERTNEAMMEEPAMARMEARAVAAMDAYDADPSRGRTIAKLRKRLAAKRAKYTKA